jgi:arylsulfatase A-like enzyme
MKPSDRPTPPLVSVAALLLLLALVAPVLGSPDVALAEEAQPPNLILLLTDDQTMDSMSQGMPYLNSRPGGHWVEFSNSFLNVPQCCPSRATILSGLYAHHTGVRVNKDGLKFDASSTIATWLDDAGYRTGLVGKYLNHYPWNQAPFVPPGWDDWFALTGGEAYYNYSVNDNGSLVSFGGAPEHYSTDVFAGQAEEFITSSTGPFFLQISPVAPHAPTTPAPRYANLGVTVTHSPNFNELDVSDKPAWVRDRPLADASGMSQWDNNRAKAFRTLRAVDDLFRRIDDALRTTGRSDNTVIVFMTDNGTTLGEHRISGKSCVYEECVRTPMLIRYPWGDQRVEPRLVSNVDIAPTFAGLAGLVPPVPQDGRSLVPLLRNDPDVSWRDEVLLEHFAGAGNPAFWAIRTPSWKYAELDTGERELYDMVGDPYELENVAGQPAMAGIEDELSTRLASLKTDSAGRLLPVIQIGDVQAAEGASSVEIPVTLSLTSSSPVTVVFGTRDGDAEASDDYTAAAGTLTIPTGDLVGTIEIPIIDDAIAEPDETFLVLLSQPTLGTIDDAQAIATILNDDTTPAISLADAATPEGDAGSSMAMIDVSMSAPVADLVTVSFATSDGSAQAGQDYVAASGTITFSPGEVTETIGLEILGDGEGEPDQNLFVDLADPVNAIIVDPHGVLTITNDDPLLSLAIGDTSLVEGNTGTATASLSVSLSGPSDDEVTALFSTNDDSATAGLDYTATSGTLVFAPGQTSAEVNVPVLGDTLSEPTERFLVDLTSESVWVQDPRGVATIQDDEPTPSISINDVPVTEGNSGTKPAVLTLVLSGPSSAPVDVSFITTNDTARAGSDYQAEAGVLRFVPGVVRITVTVLVFGDITFENSERFFIDLSAPVGASIADGRGLVTIKNDDPKT